MLSTQEYFYEVKIFKKYSPIRKSNILPKSSKFAQSKNEIVKAHKKVSSLKPGKSGDKLHHFLDKDHV